MSVNKNYYLSQDIFIEPLVRRWYAHPYLLCPTTLPLVLRDKIRLMNSFISSPELHEMALASGTDISGMFLNTKTENMTEITHLLENTLENSEVEQKIAEAIRDLQTLLVKTSKGYSLEPVYKQVPEVLKGFVELLYDVNNQAGFRFFESMLYRGTDFYQKGQSLAFRRGPERGHILDSPRLESESVFELPCQFADLIIDDIAQLRVDGGQKDNISRLMVGLSEKNFSEIFTERAPEKTGDNNYRDDDIRIRYFGHACVLLQTKEVSVMIDPFINYSDAREGINFSFADLPDKIDYVLITHSHVDHIIPEYLLQLRYKIGHIVVPRNGNGNLEDPSLKLMLESIGFSVIELDELQVINIPGGKITGLPFLGEHCDLTIRSKILHHVKLHGKSILLASDSSNLEIEVYRILRKIIGKVDLIFLGMESEGAPLSINYGSFMTEPLNWKMDQSRRVNGSDFDSGYAIVREFNPSAVFIYAMGLEPWTRYILGIQYTEESVQLQEANKLITKCRDEGTHAELLQYKKEIIIPAERDV